jgi:hypothetical protein
MFERFGDRNPTERANLEEWRIAAKSAELEVDEVQTTAIEHSGIREAEHFTQSSVISIFDEAGPTMAAAFRRALASKVRICALGKVLQNTD